MYAAPLRLVNEHGHSLDPRIERVLVQMRPRLLRQFPTVRDDAALVDVLEEAARRILRRERRHGPIAQLHGYAWVTLRSIVHSRLRRGDARLMAHTIASATGETLLARAGATSHTAAELERRVLLREVLEVLTPQEQRVCEMKTAGYSTREIARALGRSAISVDTIYSRAKARARRRTTR